MSNERINVHYINAELNTIWDKTKEKDFPPMNRHMAYGTLVDKLLAELKRCYERLDWLQQVADLAADNIGRKNWDGFEEAMYEAGLWERPSE